MLQSFAYFILWSFGISLYFWMLIFFVRYLYYIYMSFEVCWYLLVNRSFWLHWSPSFTFFFFLVSNFCMWKKSLPTQSQRYSLMFSSMCSAVLSFMYVSVYDQSWLIFVYERSIVWVSLRFILSFWNGYPVIWGPLLKRLSFWGIGNIYCQAFFLSFVNIWKYYSTNN